MQKQTSFFNIKEKKKQLRIKVYDLVTGLMNNEWRNNWLVWIHCYSRYRSNNSQISIRQWNYFFHCTIFFRVFTRVAEKKKTTLFQMCNLKLLFCQGSISTKKKKNAKKVVFREEWRFSQNRLFSRINGRMQNAPLLSPGLWLRQEAVLKEFHCFGWSQPSWWL